MKTVLITGGAGSIGGAFARKFANEGFRVGIVDVDRERADLVVNQLPSQVHRHFAITECDISSMRGVDRLFGLLPEDTEVVVLINNAAGNSASYSADDSIEERWDKTMNNDLKHVFLMTERAVVDMRENGGAVINISSIAGNLLGSKSLPYAAANSAIMGLTRSFARIYGGYNIRVNAIVPGVVANERTEIADSSGYFSAVRDQTPVKRWGTAQEIAEAAFFLASDKCTFINGTGLVIDGGATLTLGPRIDEPIPFKWEQFGV